MMHILIQMAKKLHLVISSLFILCNGFPHDDGYNLKQVLILSRHNLRTPLADNLDEITPLPWPQWKEKPGFLTAKGSILEGYMGAYFSEWMKKEMLLPDGCPNESMVHIYANVKQRTIASAKAFSKSAFPGCNVPVHHGNKDIDPTFFPGIHNGSEVFKIAALEAMEARLKTLQLNDTYRELENILQFKNSSLCKQKNICDLINEKTTLLIETGLRPAIRGPVKLGNSVTDAFIMEYFDGFSHKDIAWGTLNKDDDWHKLMTLTIGYHNVLFNTTIVARDIAHPMISYIRMQLLKDKPKMTLLMGHDSNIYTILKAMNFKPYSVHDQYEVSPVGGKIVFQKWYNEVDDKDFLKINYVYQSNEQLRNGTELSLSKPPQFIEMALTDCVQDAKGYCPWSDFMQILNDL